MGDKKYVTGGNVVDQQFYHKRALRDIKRLVCIIFPVAVESAIALPYLHHLRVLHHAWRPILGAVELDMVLTTCVAIVLSWLINRIIKGQ